MVGLGAWSGYEIKRAVELSIRFVSTISPVQIYPSLERLERAGLIHGRAAPRGKGPRRFYNISIARVPASPGRCSPSTSIFAELALSVDDDGDTGPSRLAREPGSQMRRSTTRRKARRTRRTRRCRSRTLQSVARDPVCAISALPVLRDDAIEEHGRTPGGIEDTDTPVRLLLPPPMRAQVEQEQAYAWAYRLIVANWPELRIPPS
jgi:hypothetical protein